MERGLRTLLDGVIDYAGLFPPAKLEMKPSVEEYLAARGSGDNWIVSRFACPARSLLELADELEKHELKESVSVTAIGTSGKDKHHWDTALKQDEDAIEAFRLRAVSRGIIESFEVRLPDNHHTEACLRPLENLDVNELFVEVPWTGEMEESVACIAGSEFAFAKARTGGATAECFPCTGELSAFIQQCVQLEVPFKLTAGLHHPLPNIDGDTKSERHGFLNVLVATTLTLSGDLSLRQIQEILANRDAKAFEFDENGLAWDGHRATIEQIEDGRDLFRSFGSCSIAEPLEDLANLGLMKAEAVRAARS